MLENAILHKAQLEPMLIRSYDDPGNVYLNPDGYIDFTVNHTDNWSVESYVSIDADGTIIGHFSARVSRNTRQVSSLYIINFGDKQILFGRDLQRFMYLLLMQRRYYKVSFYVAIGNPAEKLYDKYIDRFGGRIVGYQHKHVLLPNGERVDTKSYEIFQEDFEKSLKEYRPHR